MKLLVIAPSFPDKENRFYGGIFIKREVKALSKYVDEINVISPIPISFGMEFEDKVCRDYSFDNVNVHFPRFFHLPLNYFRRRRGDREAKAIEKVIKEKNIDFDLIHAHFTWPSGYAGVKLAEKFGVPVVITAHGDDVRIPLTNYIRSFDNKYLLKVLDIVVKKADVVVTHHEEILDLLSSRYSALDKNKFVFIYKGIDLSVFDPKSPKLKMRAHILKEKFNLEDKFIVLFLARVDWDKDPETFIKAAERLKSYDDIKFILVGEGSLRKKIERYIQKKELNNILIMGSRSDTEIWYYISDVYCALSPIENIWSTTLQEALCMGKACIVTKVGYTTKILKHLIDAYLIEPRNPDSLSKAILTLKQDDSIKRKLEKEALRKWRRKFDINNTARSLLEIYLNLLEKKDACENHSNRH